MRMLRTPPFFPPKSGEKPYLEVFSRFGLWRDFRNDNIAILTVTSSIVINVPTRRLLAVETKDSFVLWLAKFKYQKICL